MDVLTLGGLVLMAFWAWQAIAGYGDSYNDYQRSRESRESEWPEERDDGGDGGGPDLDMGI
jgi:hypothetical protein